MRIEIRSDEFEFVINAHGISKFNTRAWRGSADYYSEMGEVRLHTPDRVFISESLAEAMATIAAIIEEEGKP